MTDYYTGRAVACWKEYELADWCPLDVDDHYYRMFAKAHPDDNTKGVRGCERDEQNCCSQCDTCPCFCNGSEAEDDPPGEQDATFSQSSWDTLSNVTVTISDVDAPDWAVGDCADFVSGWGGFESVNGSYNCVYDGVISNYYQWSLITDNRVVGTAPEQCDYLRQCVVLVANSTGGGYTKGHWYVIAYSTLSGIEFGCPCSNPSGNSFGGNAQIEYCSDGEVSMEHSNPPATGNATVSWETGELSAPDTITATFSGDIEPCPSCTAKSQAAACIEQLKDPGGILMPHQNTSCGWGSPWLPIRATPGWFFRVTTSISALGDESEWNTRVRMIDYRHKKDEVGLPGGIPGLRYACIYDWHVHEIFQVTSAGDRYNCGGAEGGNNDGDCNDTHVTGDGGGTAADDWDNCTSGGSVSLS